MATNSNIVTRGPGRTTLVVDDSTNTSMVQGHALVGTGGAGTPTGTLVATEAPDIFTGAGNSGFPTGTFNVTEPSDNWWTGGLQDLGIERTYQSYDGSASIINTDGANRVVLLCFASIIASPDKVAIIESVSDSTGSPGLLDWKPCGQNIVGPSTPDNYICNIQMFWAFAHDKLTNISVTPNYFSDHGPSATTLSVHVIKGINGGFVYPFDPNPKAFGGAIGDFVDDNNVTATTSNPNNLVTGNGDGLATPRYLTVAIHAAFQSLTASPVSASGLSFTELTMQGPGGGTVAMSVSVAKSNVSVPASPPVYLTGASSRMWMLLWNTFVQGADNPGSFDVVEAPDRFSGVGYPGAFGFLGNLAATDPQDVFSAVGIVPTVGVWTSTEAKDVFSAFGFQPLSGVLTATEAKDVFNATGIGQGVDGVFITTEGIDIFAAIGNTPISGTFDTFEAPDRFNALGVGVTQVRRRRSFFVT